MIVEEGSVIFNYDTTTATPEELQVCKDKVADLIYAVSPVTGPARPPEDWTLTEVLLVDWYMSTQINRRPLS